jgi:hypothetical protein
VSKRGTVAHSSPVGSGGLVSSPLPVPTANTTSEERNRKLSEPVMMR